MLNKNDFVTMLGELQAHLAKTIGTVDSMIADVEDKELRYRFVALRQQKQLHFEAMRALTKLVKDNVSSIEPEG